MSLHKQPLRRVPGRFERADQLICLGLEVLRIQLSVGHQQRRFGFLQPRQG